MKRSRIVLVELPISFSSRKSCFLEGRIISSRAERIRQKRSPGNSNIP